MNRRGITILIAVAAMAGLHCYLNQPGGALPEPWHMPAWKWQILPLIAGLSAVVPGAVVGFIAGRNGLLLGAAVGLAGHVAASGFWYADGPASVGSWFNSVQLKLSSLFYVVVAALGHAVLSAAGGAAGQVLRSNKLLERTHER